MNDREKLADMMIELKGYLEEIYEFPTLDCFLKELAMQLVANGVTVQNLDGCEYCHGLPRSERDCFTMPNASKRDYDIVTIKFCPMCGRKFPEPPKGELQCE